MSITTDGGERRGGMSRRAANTVQAVMWVSWWSPGTNRLLVRAVACWMHDNYAAMGTRDDSGQAGGEKQAAGASKPGTEPSHTSAGTRMATARCLAKKGKGQVAVR